MRFLLLLLSLVLQLNVSGFANHNPQENHVIKILNSENTFSDERSYNRFWYYDPDSRNYLSQDPIGLAGNNPTLYGYVKDVNSWMDVLGLNPSILYHYTNQAGMEGILGSEKIRPSLKEVNPRNARYGNGQYFSDIITGTKTSSQLGREFINVPNKHKYTHYVAIDVTGLYVVKGRDGVFVVIGDTELDVSKRIVDSK